MQPSSVPDSDLALLQDSCVPFLVGAQNQDGGWSFQPSCESRVEPTCWSLLALRDVPCLVATEVIASGRQYLLAAQLRDGSAARQLSLPLVRATAFFVRFSFCP